jgi:hypothetical protein
VEDIEGPCARGDLAGVPVFRVHHRGGPAVMSFPAWNAWARASAGGPWHHHAEGVRE